jgi:hypothetical protein
MRKIFVRNQGVYPHSTSSHISLHSILYLTQEERFHLVDDDGQWSQLLWAVERVVRCCQPLTYVRIDVPGVLLFSSLLFRKPKIAL